VSFAPITLCVASQRVFVVVYFVMTKSGNFWVKPSSSVGRSKLNWKVVVTQIFAVADGLLRFVNITQASV